ncbi:MAG TPA: rhomboid family intramembrane serine protease [Saprospiraceae bacterium]|nr:rhomboid family intramembrane serine protease [Saprospiraceae bacterium]
MSLSITVLIIAFTALISYQGFTRYDRIDRLKHFPYRETHNKEWFRMLTSGFVHADWVHLLINMFVLYSFGAYIEEYLMHVFGNPSGHLIFLFLYLANIVLANIPTMYMQKDNPGFSSIGASGAVSGMVFIFILLNPWSILNLFFVIPVPAVVAGVIYLGYSSWAARKGQGRLDHTAHFAGALAGMAMIILINHDIVTEFFRKLVEDFPLK